MNDLIPVFKSEIGGEMVWSAHARVVHGTIKAKQKFADWIKGRIKSYGFAEHADYEVVLGGSEGQEEVFDRTIKNPVEVFHKTMKNPQGGRPIVDYIVTLDMAKELAMVERNETGRQVRRYFIAYERQMRARLESGGYITDPTGRLQELASYIHRSAELIGDINNSYPANELAGVVEELSKATEVIHETVRDMDVAIDLVKRRLKQLQPPALLT